MGKWTRRAVVTAGSLAGGGLLLGVGTYTFAPNRYKIGRQQGPGLSGLNTWLAIHSSGDIRVLVPHCEMGQGSQTALAMMLCDELDGDWSQVRVEEAPAIQDLANGHLVNVFMPLKAWLPIMQRGHEYLTYRAARYYGVQATGGSASIRGTGQLGFRAAGASAREMLVRAAAARWDVAYEDCSASASVVKHAASKRQASYAELAQAAAALTPPMRPVLKSPAQFTVIGTPRKRLEIPNKVDGSARFGVDAWMPGLLFAAVRAAPVFGATLTACDHAAADKMPGVKRVLTTTDEVAVVANSSYRATQALATVQCQYSFGAGQDKVTSATLRADGERALAAGPYVPVIERGDTAKALLATPAAVVRARYEVPFLAHATMEPMNATARFGDGKLELWTSVQDPLHACYVAAKELGLEPQDVVVHNGFLGGGFGRRLPGQHDFVLQAARIAKAMAPAPVKLIWSREEDMTRGYFRPAAASSLAGLVDDQGRLLAWQSRFTDDDAEAGHPLYAVPNIDIAVASAANHVRTGPWRSVSHSFQGFFVESFVDELAAAARKDPYRFRYDLLAQDARARAVLARAAELSEWGRPLAENHARGIALVRSFGSYVAEVAEIEVLRDAAGKPMGLKVPRVFAAVDCGILVNPLTAEAQIQGGVVMGLSAALGEAITIDSGAVVERNFHQYPLLRMPDAPAVTVDFMRSTEKPGGLGEPGLPPIAPAVANAWFAATGQRLRRLPLLAEIARA